MPRAAFIGTTVDYTDYYGVVMIETSDGRVNRVVKKTFDYLYYKLGPFTAALKGDCIEYEINDYMIPDSERSDWYLEAEMNGDIYDMCGSLMFRIDEYGAATEMSSNSVILRNFKGELRYMEWDDFTKYYDVRGSEFID